MEQICNRLCCIVAFINRHQDRLNDITFGNRKSFDADGRITDKFTFFCFLVDNRKGHASGITFFIFRLNFNRMFAFFQTIKVQCKACHYTVIPSTLDFLTIH